jgi:hypothetical protein
LVTITSVRANTSDAHIFDPYLLFLTTKAAKPLLSYGVVFLNRNITVLCFCDLPDEITGIPVM